MPSVERKKYLESLKDLAKKIKKQNTEFDCGKDTWKRKVVSRNITTLKQIIEELNYKLKSNNLKNFEEASKYLESKPPTSYLNLLESNDPEFNNNLRTLFNGGYLFFKETEIANCTIIASIDFDFNLVHHLNSGEIKKLAFGIIEIDIIRNYITDAVDKVKDKTQSNHLTLYERQLLFTGIDLINEKNI